MHDREYAFACMYTKLCQVIRHGGPRFAEFLSRLTIELKKKAELYRVLEYYRAVVQRARSLCFHKKLLISHKEFYEVYQVRKIPIVLFELKSHPQATFSLAERVAPTEVRRVLQAGSTFAYKRTMADNMGPVNKDSADG